jgi:hypothetical protein
MDGFCEKHRESELRKERGLPPTLPPVAQTPKTKHVFTSAGSDGIITQDGSTVSFQGRNNSCGAVIGTCGPGSAVEIQWISGASYGWFGVAREAFDFDAVELLPSDLFKNYNAKGDGLSVITSRGDSFADGHPQASFFEGFKVGDKIHIKFSADGTSYDFRKNGVETKTVKVAGIPCNDGRRVVCLGCSVGYLYGKSTGTWGVVNANASEANTVDSGTAPKKSDALKRLTSRGAAGINLVLAAAASSPRAR